MSQYPTVTRYPLTDLVHDSGHEEPDLHEHEVGGRVKVGEVDEGEVVVEAGGNCTKIGLPVKSILSKRKGHWEVLFS